MTEPSPRGAPAMLPRRVLSYPLLTVGWVMSRALLLLLAYTVEADIATDHRHYWAAFTTGGPWFSVLPEYPPAAVLLLGLPWLLAQGSFEVFSALCVAVMVTIDGLTTVALALLERGTRAVAGYWVGFIALLGPCVYFRFDLAASALVAVAFVATRRGVGLSGGLWATAVAVKLWPLVGFPALLLLQGWGRRLGGFLLGGIGWLAFSLAVAGTERTLAPLAYQSERGLQVESVLATPALVGRALGGNYQFTIAYGAWEVFGPGTGLAVQVSMPLSLLLLATVAVVFCWGRPWPPLGRSERTTAAVFCLALLTAFLLANKVLSAQYPVWLLPVLGVLAGVQRPSTALRTVTGLGLAVAALTHAVYPYFYGDLLASDGMARWVATAILTLRNLGLIALWVAALIELRNQRPGSAHQRATWSRSRVVGTTAHVS